MRRTLFLVALPLVVLTGCGSSTFTYHLSFDSTDEARQHDLTVRSLSVVERRLEALNADVKDEQILTKDKDVRIQVKLADSAAGKVLTQQLTEPYKLRIMHEDDGAKPDITVEGQGGFSQSGITEKDVLWGEAAQDSDGKGGVKITFTPDGAKKMVALFKDNQGKNIGIFVRDRLVSKLKVNATMDSDNIVIRGIPSLDVAKVFVDDLNVGLHVTFTPAP